MTATPTPARTPDLTDAQTMEQRVDEYWKLTTDWAQNNLLELSLSAAAAILVFLLLSWLKHFATRIARESEHRAQLKSIVARTLARTSKFFRIMVAVQLVNGYANAPAMLGQTIDILFTIAVVFQVAIWLREVILGLIERRAGEGEHEHETLQSAMVLIRVLVSFALFAIAAIVVLDNLGINVTGLVAGLGVGGIAIGLAAQGIFSDLFAAISIIFDKPFRRGDTVTYDAPPRDDQRGPNDQDAVDFIEVPLVEQESMHPRKLHGPAGPSNHCSLRQWTAIRANSRRSPVPTACRLSVWSPRRARCPACFRR